MKKFFLIYFILCLCLSGKAQNLVPNGDYEIYDTLSGGVMFPKYWDMYASPDYYNFNIGNVPKNSVGYQQSFNGGQGYIGEYMICSQNTAGDGLCREYIKTTLTDTLEAGHKYFASMFVSKGDGLNYAIASIGMLFTNTVIPQPQSSNYVVINANPQIINTVVISDTLNWISIQDTFTAIGGEYYLTIGNFSSTQNSDTLYVKGNGSISGKDSYYYIDHVSVYDITTTIGIEKEHKEKFSIYPNPASDKIYVEAKEIKEIRITDLLGKEVIVSREKEIDVSALAEGIYLYRIITKENAVSCGKVVILK